jgi:ribosomal protein S18 acetylase RimI-like enzyme
VLNADGIKHADHLYAEFERQILESPGVTPGMFIELFTHRGNERAIRFWQNQHFQDIGTSEGNQNYRRFLRYPWDAPAAMGAENASPPESTNA